MVLGGMCQGRPGLAARVRAPFPHRPPPAGLRFPLRKWRVFPPPPIPPLPARAAGVQPSFLRTSSFLLSSAQETRLFA